ncbi:MAG TPA: ornithine cyclodeaminase family protein [Terriglobales bacterium]|nr:ornithine cyclodeaminase family protein [Terriglobales bacterium]
MLILSEKEVQSLAQVEELIPVLERAHVQYSTGKAVMPVRLVVPLPQIEGRITSMPGYLNEDKALGMKVVTFFPNNLKQNLPQILATVMLFSAETGKMIAAMDGNYITAIRTACVSAMATKALANPQSRVLGVLGAGVQARAHIRALTQIRKISEIRVYDIAEASARQLQESLQKESGIKINVVQTARGAVLGTDLLVTVTTAKEPIVKKDWLQPGMHINAVGSHRPDLREIDGATLASAKVVVDSREAIMAECGDILLAIREKTITADHVHAEIGEVLAGKKPGRTSPDEITLYKAVGIAIQDVATAHLVYRRALEQNVGTNIEV